MTRVGARKLLLGRKPAVSELWTPALPTTSGGVSPYLWLKADAGTFQDAAMTIPAVLNGDVVGGWQDQSGNGRHATQAVTADKPTLRLAVQNGLPIIRFDGVNDDLELVGAEFALGAQNRTLLMALHHAAASDFDFDFSLGPVVGNGAAWRNGNSGGDIREEITGQGYTTSLAYAGAFALIAIKMAGNTLANHTFYLNGASEAGAGGNAINTTAGTPSIGSKHRAAPFTDVDIGETLLYVSALSDVDLNQVANYLERFGVIWVDLP